MAHSPILHVKDCYFFEVPKFMWRYEKMSQIPGWLRDSQHMSLTEWKHELDGKILIPQPLGTPKNLYEWKSGFCISKFMLLELVAAFVVAMILIRYAARVKDGQPAKGRFWNLIEAMLLYIRDGVARPSIPDDHGHDGHGHDDHGRPEHGGHGHGAEPHVHGAQAVSHEAQGASDAAVTPDAPMAHTHVKFDHHGHAKIIKPAADKFLPFLWTLFFFLLGCNLLGMIPWMGSPTGAIAMTGAMAIIAFLKVTMTGIGKLGFVGFWKSLVPHMDLPLALAILLIPMIFAIELMGLVIKHFVLCVRLMANMFAGHLVLAVILGFTAATANSAIWYGVMPAAVLGATALSMLELFVAFLQAYIFTFLTALFIGSAVHPH